MIRHLWPAKGFAVLWTAAGVDVPRAAARATHSPSDGDGDPAWRRGHLASHSESFLARGSGRGDTFRKRFRNCYQPCSGKVKPIFANCGGNSHSCSGTFRNMLQWATWRRWPLSGRRSAKSPSRRASRSRRSRASSTGAGRLAETRDNVTRVIRDNGYTANRSARGLSAGRTGFVGVVVPLVFPAYFSGILDGAAEALFERDLQIVLSPTRQEHDREVSRSSTVCTASPTAP